MSSPTYNTTRVIPSNETRTAYDISGWEYAVIWSTFGTLIAVGLIANSLMILTLRRMDKSVFHVVVMGLCFSDIISACNSSLVVLSGIDMAFGMPSVGCFVPTVVNIATSIVTVYLVLLLSVVRFRSVVYALESRGEMTAKKSTLIVHSIWIMSMVISLPFVFIFEIAEMKGSFRCNIKTHIPYALKYMCAFSVTVGIFVPMLLVVGFCVAIMAFLICRKQVPAARSKTSSSKSKQKQALKQLGTIVGSFFIAYATDYGTTTYMISRGLNGKTTLVLGMIAHGILRLSECLNPLLYYWGSKEIREESKRMCRDAKIKFSFNGEDCSNGNAAPAVSASEVPNPGSRPARL